MGLKELSQWIDQRNEQDRLYQGQPGLAAWESSRRAPIEAKPKARQALTRVPSRPRLRDVAARLLPRVAQQEQEDAVEGHEEDVRHGGHEHKHLPKLLCREEKDTWKLCQHR